MMTDQFKQWLKAGGNGANALDDHPALLEQVETEYNNLVDRVLPALLGNDCGVFVTYQVVDDTITFTVTYNEYPNKFAETEFRRRAASQTEDEFLTSIKAYFFDLCYGFLEAGV